MIYTNHHFKIFYSILLLVLTYPVLRAQIVDPPVPITHTVTVSRIVSESSDGEVATGFGNAAQEADIISRINSIWAQAGVEIIFLPVQTFVDDFTYDDNGTVFAEGESRPTGDLNTIINLPNLPDTPSNIDIEMVFVKAVPGFGTLTPSTAAGLAFIDRPGTTVFVGESLLTFPGGRIAIAGVMAHEIGHNLGLPHVANGGPNLMSPSGSTDQLTADQFSTIFTDRQFFIDGFDLLIETSSQTNYEEFVSNLGIQGGPDDDDDNDGLSNLVEFSIGTDPVDERNNLPPVIQVNNSAFSWTIPKTTGAIDDNINYEIQFSADLQGFEPAGTNNNSAISIDNDSQITATSSLPDKGFFRLSVEQPAETLAAQSSLPQSIQDKYVAQLAREDRPWDKVDLPKRLCACGQEH